MVNASLEPATQRRMHSALLRTACAAAAVMTTCPARSHAQSLVIPQNGPRLQTLYLEEAQRRDMWVGPEHKSKAELVVEPVFRWQNLSRANGQSGALFVWTHDGRPVVIGGVFSNPENDRRIILHEFHALGPERLYPEFRDSESKWLPGAGVMLDPFPDSPEVESTRGRRTLNLRTMARDFTASSTDDQGQKWELRLLPRPLYRYEKSQGDIIDGAILAFVSDAGTDPEVVLVLETRQANGITRWYYRAVRLSISDLSVDYHGKRV